MVVGLGLGFLGGVLEYHFLNSLPWGASLTLLIINVARWQYSWARTLIRRSGGFGLV